MLSFHWISLILFYNRNFIGRGSVYVNAGCHILQQDDILYALLEDLSRDLLPQFCCLVEEMPLHQHTTKLLLTANIAAGPMNLTGAHVHFRLVLHFL